MLDIQKRKYKCLVAGYKRIKKIQECLLDLKISGVKFELKEPIIFSKTLVRYKNIPNSDIYGFIFLNKDLSLKTYLSLEIGYVLDVNQPDLDLGWHRVWRLVLKYFLEDFEKKHQRKFGIDILDEAEIRNFNGFKLLQINE